MGSSRERTQDETGPYAYFFAALKEEKDSKIRLYLSLKSVALIHCAALTTQPRVSLDKITMNTSHYKQIAFLQRKHI